MSELRLRPKSDYLHTAAFEELYVLGEHWQSVMEFYHLELDFLKKLIDKYFIWLLKDEHIAKVQVIVNEI